MALATQALALAAKERKPKVPLVRIGTQFFREETLSDGKVVLIPVDVEFNLDPLELAKTVGVAAAGTLAVGAAGLAAWLAWDGLALAGFQVWRGIKEAPFWQKQAKRYGAILTTAQETRDQKKAQDLLKSIGDAECQLLNREWATARREGRFSDALRFLEQARAGGCPWTQGIL